MLWFGDKSTTSKKEVRRVSTQVNRLLSNVAYEYPGPQCRENVYAYVHPNPPYNKNDREGPQFRWWSAWLAGGGFIHRQLDQLGSQSLQQTVYSDGEEKMVLDVMVLALVLVLAPPSG
ncbi:unnamed protein product [Durusdinium trenchii]|uniref:Uncharacterized protein n=1 Tax=Durusdinium trenchii TaxID=1381693 RepID=A0ABP0K062_9DINO